MWIYMIGAAGCGMAAWYIKRKASDKKKVYEAVWIMLAGFLMAAILWQIDESGKTRQKITRNLPGQGAEEKDYLVDVEGILEQYPLKIQVEEKKLTKEQKQECLEKARKELDKVIPGKNPSAEQVTEPLYLPETLQDGMVEASYTFSDYEVFDPQGRLTGKLKEPVLVKITAELICQEETCLYEFFVQAVPAEQSVEEQFIEQLEGFLQVENQKTDTVYLELPEELEGNQIVWKEQTENRSILVLFLGAACAVGVFLADKEERKRKELKRQQQMLLDYPEIVSKLSLLLGAGMNIMYAWEKIAITYQDGRERRNQEKREAYEEMLTVLHEIQGGVGELQAFENFGARCGLSSYRKLSSLIVQNIRKGARGMQKLLEEEEREAFEQRKARARKAGEEAGTKLLLPMGIMLILVLVILVVPAGLTLQI